MVLSIEYRIPMPLCKEEYEIGQLYGVARLSAKEGEELAKKKGKDGESGGGVEFLDNEAYTDDEHGSGWYTYKIIHLANKLPGWIKTMLPVSSLQLREQCWIPDPEYKQQGFHQTTSYRCPMFDQLTMSVRTTLSDGDIDFEDSNSNVFGLTEEELKGRKVEMIRVEEVWDCLGPEQPDEENPAKVGCPKAERPPLGPDWIASYRAAGRPVMCVHKLVTCSFKYWGVQDRVEALMQRKGFMEIFYKMHRPMLPWMTEWYGMTKDDIRVYEERTRVFLEQLRESGEGEPTEEGPSSQSTRALVAGGGAELGSMEQGSSAARASTGTEGTERESCWSISVPEREPLPPNAPIADIIEAILKRQNAMDQQQQQISHHVAVLSKYLQYQQHLVQETKDTCGQVVTAASAMPQPNASRAEGTSQGNGGNVFTNMFKFGNKE